MTLLALGHAGHHSTEGERVTPKATKTRWGYTPQQWEDSKAEAKRALMQRASSRGTVSYSDLCGSISTAAFRPYSWSLMALLEEICSEEDAAHGVMLASLVVRRDSGMPGEGYFAHAARLGRDTEDREGFWRSEIERVWEVYAG